MCNETQPGRGAKPISEVIEALLQEFINLFD